MLSSKADQEDKVSPNMDVELITHMFAAVETGDMEFITSNIDPAMKRHDLVGAYPDVTGETVSDFLSHIRAAVPDLRLPIADAFGDDGRVAVRFRFEGTHSGELLGIPASGQPISVNAVNIYRIEDGLLRET